MAALDDWGLSRLGDTVSLLVTELVSNGVRHARPGLELILSFDGRCLRIAVADGDPRPPGPGCRPGLSVGRVGTGLVDSLSTEWGADIDDNRGKTVWFEIDTTDVFGRRPGLDGPMTPGR